MVGQSQAQAPIWKFHKPPGRVPKSAFILIGSIYRHCTREVSIEIQTEILTEIQTEIRPNVNAFLRQILSHSVALCNAIISLPANKKAPTA